MLQYLFSRAVKFSTTPMLVCCLGFLSYCNRRLPLVPAAGSCESISGTPTATILLGRDIRISSLYNPPKSLPVSPGAGDSPGEKRLFGSFGIFTDLFSDVDLWILTL